MSPLHRQFDDASLAASAQRGCAASFEELLRRYQSPLLHFLRGRGLGADAEDVLQETFLRAHAQLARYRPQWPFAAWLFTIARRCGLNYSRRKRPETGGADWDLLPDRRPEPTRQLSAEEDSRNLWATARRVLSEEQHTALWLHYVEGMPVAQIAAVLGRSLVGVKTVMFRARRLLLPHVEPYRPAASALRCHQRLDRREAVAAVGVSVAGGPSAEASDA